MNWKKDFSELGLLVLVALIMQLLWNISFSILGMSFEALVIMMISLLTAIVIVRPFQRED